VSTFGIAEHRVPITAQPAHLGERDRCLGRGLAISVREQLVVGGGEHRGVGVACNDPRTAELEKQFRMLTRVGRSHRQGRLVEVHGAGERVQRERPIAGIARADERTRLEVRIDRLPGSPEQLERIHQDKTIKQDVFSHTDSEREWSGKFRPPVEAKISDVFGTQRMFNGKVQSVHQGLDYAVPGGTPVSAVNAGTVLLASPLYFEGNCVVLDHGQGLMTLYLHLSEIKVKQGERIERGQEIGRSGGTGRASGPHLHLAVRWQGVYLNPATLLALKLP